MKTSHYNYHNTEIKTHHGGKKIVRKVSIKHGKGYKSVTKYHQGKKISSIKKPIHKSHVEFIKLGKFIPGLFMDCAGKNKTRRNKTRRNKTP